jgi:ubiquinone/menaquinone biosynthesis C-methylase UbiE
LNTRELFHALADRTRAAVAVAALLVPSPAAAAKARSAAHPAPANPDEPDFSNVAKYAKAFDSPKRDYWQKPDEVMNLLQLWPGNVVADIGAGTGHFEPHLAKAVGPTGRVLALDVEPQMIAYLKRRAKKEKLGNVTAQEVAADDPGLADGSVDRLLVVNTWHHLPQRAQYAAAMNRALRPGGFVVVIDFTAESPEGPPAHARLSPATVIAELQAGGFSARTVAESLPFQYVVIGQKQVASKGRPTLTARQRALVDVIKANADRARFTRGVNTETVHTLAKAVGPTDDPELRALLYHDDPLVTRATASVFAARGDGGLAVLREVAVDAALPANNRSVLDDVIWTANAREAAARGAIRYVNPGPELSRAPRPPRGTATALDED